MMQPMRDDVESAFDQAWEVARTIEGWLTREQARRLFDACRQVSTGCSIVEIGSHHGRSTIVLAAAKPEGTRLVAIDPFDSPRWGGGESALGVFRSNLRRAGCDDQVSVFRGTSREAAAQWDAGSVGLLYVDGAHDRESVLHDIDGWEPHLAERGQVFFHDAFSSVGVTLALLQRHLLSLRFSFSGTERSLAGFRRERVSVPAAVWNGVRVAGRLAYFARNLMVKFSMRRKWHRVVELLGHREAAYPY